MNIYEHEDAFKEANLHAENVVNLSNALKVVTDKDSARIPIGDLQKQYENLFEAFIAGVAWARAQSPNADTRKE